MSKAILVIDMPKTCGECILANEDYDCCQATQKSISYNERGYGVECPLKPMPQKKKEVRGFYYQTTWEIGYNACIDEILGEKE